MTGDEGASGRARMSGRGRGTVADRAEHRIVSQRPRRPDRQPATAPVSRSARLPALVQCQQRRLLRVGSFRAAEPTETTDSPQSHSQ